MSASLRMIRNGSQKQHLGSASPQGRRPNTPSPRSSQSSPPSPGTLTISSTGGPLQRSHTRHHGEPHGNNPLLHFFGEPHPETPLAHRRSTSATPGRTRESQHISTWAPAPEDSDGTGMGMAQGSQDSVKHCWCLFLAI